MKRCLLWVLCAFVLLSISGCEKKEESNLHPELYQDYHLVWSDEFDGSAKGSYVIDSSALVVTVNNTSDEDWKVQIKQNNILLEKGKTYKLSFCAKSDSDRDIRVVMQGLEGLGLCIQAAEPSA